MRPRILQANFGDSLKFQNLSSGFQKVFTKEEGRDEHALKLPIAGYTGHCKGQKAENVFAKSYRDTAILAETNIRQFRK